MLSETIIFLFKFIADNLGGARSVEANIISKYFYCISQCNKKCNPNWTQSCYRKSRRKRNPNSIFWQELWQCHWKKGLLNRLKNFSGIKVKFYFINLSQISTFTKYSFFQILTFQGTYLSNNRIPSQNKGTLRFIFWTVSLWEFTSWYLRNTQIFYKIAPLVQKLPGDKVTLSK